ncbi:MAG: Fe-S protein assembly chaperone HscA [Pseudomonadota bacterium]|nr:Fe-S protein assembly chaperone HscA [Pseudomonadota bacterium]
MALLQISEPGASPDLHARRHAVGIDLGTTHSLVAAVRSGVAECLPDRDGEVILPSAVRYLADGTTRIGREALAGAVSDPTNTVVSVKRLMGRGLADVSSAGRLAYDFVAANEGMVRLRTAAGIKSPVEISAEILATLRQRAEDTFEAELYGAVITVPAYFDDAQRQATKDAAELAGLEVLRLISEPTAASIAYGLDNGSEGLYAVYDLGGGTFDISLLRMTRGVFEVIATGGDSALGGDDIDAALAEWALDRAGVVAASAGDRRAAAIAARAVKEALSSEERALFSCIVAGAAVVQPVERADLEAIAQPFVERTIAAVRRAVRDAKVVKTAIDGIVLVGGSTRMPLVRRAVHEFFGRAPLTNLDPDQVVALGAARQADALAGNQGAGDLLLLDVVPLSLGIETMGGLVERIIERNSPIPSARGQSFTTFQDGQSAMSLHVLQGERELVADCRSLARFELRGIPPMVAGAARIQVTFAVDADGLLSVEAREQTSGVEASVTVKPSYGLSDDEVTRMLSEGFGHAEDDMAARALREAQVDADRLLGAIATALAADGELLAPEERAEIELAADALRAARGSSDRAAIERSLKALSDATEAFAAERMNRGIRRALAGRRVEDL